jgi:outer membrane protein assembly factor BamA
VITALMAVVPARADTTHVTPPPPPSWAAGRPPVPDLDAKQEGWFPDLIPEFAYDPNLGLGLGVGGHLTFDGDRSDPLFAYTPYRHRLFVQAYATTGGYQQHFLSYEGDAIGDSPFRLRATLIYERNTEANYFGNGASTLSDLSYQGTSYATYAAAVAAAGPRYFHYGFERPQGQALLERSFLGGRMRALYGVNVQYVSITRYDGSAFSPPTKLGSDCAAGLATGCDGGWNNTLRAGVAYDTRDYGPDPNSGVFIDTNGHWSARGFGSSADYLRLTTAARAYFSPFARLADVVVAGRVLYSLQSARVPFYAMETLAMSGGIDDITDQGGLGGERTMRGYRQDRFVGLVAAGASAEVRWTFAKFPLLQQRFSLQIAPFVDSGRVFDQVGLSFEDWRVSGGGGLRIGYNQSTIVMIDYGVSREDSGLYIDFGMAY